jgi:S-adenosylmethionine:tRNA ribosyltransferase-isomerase
MHPKDIDIADYTYDLPASSIAYYPPAERDSSRLLIYREGVIGETTYRHIGDQLPEGAVLVFNNTKVVEARIVFQKETGAQIEIFCLEPAEGYGGMTAAMSQTGSVRWKCLIGGASKWKPGQILTKKMEGGEVLLEARYLDKLSDSFLIELSWTPAALSFAELLHHAGLVPLPPYIQRPPEALDGERYQTVYARYDGSVAAPTAGLHFTDVIFDSLDAKNIRRTFVTLHVGAGTFLPVKAATLEHHIMHTEFIAVTREAIGELLEALREGRPIIPVGTTSARTIESLYWLGAKLIADPAMADADLLVKQWDAYGGIEQPDQVSGAGAGGGISPAVALAALLERMKERGVTQLVTHTQLMITPGYTWRIARGLITNFHQPGSTLLLLIASLVGEDWRTIYGHALERGFRFLSYGDGCLLLPIIPSAGIRG